MTTARTFQLCAMVGGLAFVCCACAMSGCAGSGDTIGYGGRVGNRRQHGRQLQLGPRRNDGGGGTGQAGSGQAGTGGGAAGTSGNAGSGAAGTSGGAGGGAAGTGGAAGSGAAGTGRGRGDHRHGRRGDHRPGWRWGAVARRGPRAGAAAPGQARPAAAGAPEQESLAQAVARAPVDPGRRCPAPAAAGRPR